MGSPTAPPISSNLPAAYLYQPTGQGAADTQLQGQFGQFQNYTNQVQPGLWSAAQQQINNPNAAWYQNTGNQAGNDSQWLANINTTAMQGLGQTAGLGNSNIASLLSLSGSNPYAQQAQQGAQTGGNILQDQSLQALRNAQSLNPSAQSNYGYASGAAGNLGQGAQSILNTAFDPQGALYQQQYQQNQDATQAALAAMGLGTSGAGAGILNQSQQNFNNQWENQQLGRQATGLGAAGSAYGQGVSGLTSGLSGLESAATTAQNIGNTAGSAYAAGAAMPANQYLSNLSGLAGLNSSLGTAGNAYGNLQSTASGLGNQAITQQLNAGALPYQTTNAIAGNQSQALQQYLQGISGGQNLSQQQMGDLMQYLGLGASAGQGLANAQNTAYNTAANQYSQSLSGFGSLLGASSGSGSLLGSGLSWLGGLVGL